MVFSKYFSVSGLTEKISQVVSNTSEELVRAAITLYVILKQPTVPVVAKTAIVGALGYFAATNEQQNKTKGHPLYGSLFSRLHYLAHHTSLHINLHYPTLSSLPIVMVVEQAR